MQQLVIRNLGLNSPPDFLRSGENKSSKKFGASVIYTLGRKQLLQEPYLLCVLMIPSSPLTVIMVWRWHAALLRMNVWLNYSANPQGVAKGKAARCISFQRKEIFLAVMELLADKFPWEQESLLQKSTEEAKKLQHVSLAMALPGKVLCTRRST